MIEQRPAILDLFLSYGIPKGVVIIIDHYGIIDEVTVYAYCGGN
jgi:hypothetical protein